MTNHMASLEEVCTFLVCTLRILHCLRLDTMIILVNQRCLMKLLFKFNLELLHEAHACLSAGCLLLEGLICYVVQCHALSAST